MKYYVNVLNGSNRNHGMSVSMPWQSVDYAITQIWIDDVIHVTDVFSDKWVIEKEA